MISPKSMMMMMRMKKPGEMRESMIGSMKQKRLVKLLPRSKQEAWGDEGIDDRFNEAEE